ncbi:MAG: USG-1 protein [Candidatus Celerinatantimonas neptuna]|nr:MAG: USG-1 protein [Candidatus Celerinatantimonas neptuna]
MTIAVLGATSLLGKALIESYVARNSDYEGLIALESVQEDGSFEVAGQSFELVHPDNFDWSLSQVVVGCDQTLVEKYADQISSLGGILLNATAASIVGSIPTLSVSDEQWAGAQGVYQVPCSSTLMVARLLQRLELEVGIDKVHISALLSVAHQGQPGIDELAGQTARLLNGLAIESDVFDKQVAFNLLTVSSDSESIAEQVEQQLPLLFRESEPSISAHSVYTPIFYGEMALVSIECLSAVSAAFCSEIWQELEGVELDDGQNLTLVTDLNRHPVVCVSQVRHSEQQPNEVKFCVQADSIKACMIPYIEERIEFIRGF